MLHTPALLALNHVLAQAEWARERLARFAGRRGRLAMAPWTLEFTVGADGLLGESGAGEVPFAVDIVLPSDAPLRLLHGPDEVMKGARITGAADFADALGFVLSRLRWNFEEDLSRLIGDIAAHRVAGVLSAFGAWQQEAARNLAENVGEYLVHERPLLVRREDLRNFAAGVDRAREDLARLERRLQRLSPG